jgi:hypothetical protein
MSKHTPAPWNMSRRGNYSHQINGDKWDALATVSTRMFGDDVDDVEGMANARLIASAPELLEALKELYAVVKEYEDLVCGEAPSTHRNAVNKARQAIAKAEGKP